ncbi:MAG TPA: hypothetical protein VK034_05525, partial [Enhygromyxa sp.]|nr:hypothetical protein [Enhygromyxa sp.]
EPSGEIAVNTRPSASWVLDDVYTVVSSEDAAAVAIAAIVVSSAIDVQSFFAVRSNGSFSCEDVGRPLKS